MDEGWAESNRGGEGGDKTGRGSRVTPAKAGVQFLAGRADEKIVFGAQMRARWIPAFAGMTVMGIGRGPHASTLLVAAKFRLAGNRGGP
jgi:hypothetical protein